LLDEAIAVPDASFPYAWTGADIGRISKAVALALKGRILLYWASPRFNPNNLQDRWQAAYEANKRAKELLEQNGYGLYDDFANLWFDEMNKEAVFVKRYNYPGGPGHHRGAGTRPYESNLPLGFSGFNKPTWELVCSFPMIDGKPINESPLYDETVFFKNRDPRFEKTIAWNSSVWELYGESGRRQWTYKEVSSYPSLSHFYCRKAVDVTYDVDKAKAGNNAEDWIEIRYAEVMINYAEAAAEVGKNDEAYAMLKEIRKRAGIIAGSDGLYGLKANMSKAEMINAIMLERKIEFAFEGKRFEDLRRRKLFSELNGKQRHGLLPILKISQEEFDAILEAGTATFVDDYATYFDGRIDVVDKYVINFKDEYYFYALNQDDLNRNSNLEQTKGWEGGTFDPLE
jgi:hypothetical protein